jgi:archaellin
MIIVRWKAKILSATFAPIPGTDISSSMEQLLMKIRGIVNNNKQQKHVAFYSVVYAYMYNSFTLTCKPHHVFQQSRVFPKCQPQTGSSLFIEAIFKQELVKNKLQVWCPQQI